MHAQERSQFELPFFRSTLSQFRDVMVYFQFKYSRKSLISHAWNSPHIVSPYRTDTQHSASSIGLSRRQTHLESDDASQVTVSMTVNDCATKHKPIIVRSGIDHSAIMQLARTQLCCLQCCLSFIIVTLHCVAHKSLTRKPSYTVGLARDRAATWRLTVNLDSLTAILTV